ncbi:MAG: hypothetical protein K2Q22_15585, partial [Cytophagales bacterium]|nr:hypothetical protein [Cytophagales bacterium]
SSPITYCQNDIATALTASGVNLEWYTVSIGGTSFPSITPSTATAGSTNYFVSQSVAGCVSSRALISVAVSSAPGTAPFVISPQSFCQFSSGDLTPYVISNPNSFGIFTSNTGGTQFPTSFVPTTATGTFHYFVARVSTLTGCAGPRIIFDVNINPTNAQPTVSSPLLYCVGAPTSQLTATGSNLLWYTNTVSGPGSSTAPTPSSASVSVTDYYVIDNFGSCPSSASLITVSVLSSLPNPGVAQVNYCLNAPATPLTASGVGLLWYTSSVGGVGSSVAPTPVTSALGSVNYFVSQSSGSCESGRSLLTVTVVSQPGNPFVFSPQSYCQFGTPATLPSLVAPASSNNLLWYSGSSGGVGSSVAPIIITSTTGTTSYYVSQTVNGCESNRSQIDININPAATAPTVTTPVSYCQGDAASPLSAIGTSFLWYTSSVGGTGSSTAPTPSTAAVGSVDYFVSENSTACESPRSQITVVVNGLPSISIAGNTNVCANVPTTLTASGASTYTWNPASGLSASTGSVVTATLAAPQTYTVTGVDMNSCQSDGIVTINISSGSAPDVTITASSDFSTPFCSGSGISFTPNPVNGGSSPIYDWYVNNVFQTTSAQFAYIPVNNDVVTVVMTPNGAPLPTCSIAPVTAPGITMVVTEVLNPMITIAPTQNPICFGDHQNYGATYTNTGSALTHIRWKNTKNNTYYSEETDSLHLDSQVGGTNDLINDGDIVQGELFIADPQGSCAVGASSYGFSGAVGSFGAFFTSNLVTATVITTQAASVTVSPDVNPICSGNNVTFTALPVNGGTPLYSWNLNGVPVGITTPTYTYLPTDADQVSVDMTVTGALVGCTTNNPASAPNVTMTVVGSVSLVPSVSILANTNTICSGSLATFTAIPTSAGSTPSYNWLVNGASLQTSTVSVFSYSASNNDLVNVVITPGGSGTSCIVNTTATATNIQVTVLNNLIPTISVTVDVNPVCSGTGVNFTAITTNEGTAPSYDWFVNGVSQANNALTFGYIPANNDIVLAILNPGGVGSGCLITNQITSSGITMTVTGASPSVSVATSSLTVCNGATVDFTATGINVGSTPNFNWLVNGSSVQNGSSTTYSYVPANNDLIEVVVTPGGSGCFIAIDATSPGLTMTTSGSLLPSVSIASSSNPICSGGTMDFTATGVNTGTAPVYGWYVNGVAQATTVTVFSYSPSNNDIIIATMNPGGSGIGCI